jgi:transposase
VLREELAVRDRQIASQELRLAELERRVGVDSGNSGTPPSKDSIAAKARRRAQRQVSQRERSKEREPGGQKGRTGAGLEPAESPDRTERADPPVECSGCGHDLSGAAQVGAPAAVSVRGGAGVEGGQQPFPAGCGLRQAVVLL